MPFRNERGGLFSFICSETEVVRAVRNKENRRLYQMKNEIDTGTGITSAPAHIGYAFHHLSSQFLSLFRRPARTSRRRWHEEGVTDGKKSLLKLQKNVKNSPVYYPSLVMLYRLFSYTCPKFIDLWSDPSQSWITFLPGIPY